MIVSDITSADIVSIIGKPAAVEQCAEEAAELAAACSKLARRMRRENPTPATALEVLEAVHSEAADVATCLGVLMDAGILDQDTIQRIADTKLERWKKRLKNDLEGKKK